MKMDKISAVIVKKVFWCQLSEYAGASIKAISVSTFAACNLERKKMLLVVKFINE